MRHAARRAIGHVRVRHAAVSRVRADVRRRRRRRLRVIVADQRRRAVRRGIIGGRRHLGARRRRVSLRARRAVPAGRHRRRRRDARDGRADARQRVSPARDAQRGGTVRCASGEAAAFEGGRAERRGNRARRAAQARDGHAVVFALPGGQRGADGHLARRDASVLARRLHRGRHRGSQRRELLHVARQSRRRISVRPRKVGTGESAAHRAVARRARPGVGVARGKLRARRAVRAGARVAHLRRSRHGGAHGGAPKSRRRELRARVRESVHGVGRRRPRRARRRRRALRRRRKLRRRARRGDGPVPARCARGGDAQAGAVARGVATDDSRGGRVVRKYACSRVDSRRRVFRCVAIILQTS
mmetsp:Transcript_809/g.3154  ORF Transcript_809/g.3154 Transcript_809/m.3154 type:complete len:359 (+) Transcript_809:754-1830(+)